MPCNRLVWFVRYCTAVAVIVLPIASAAAQNGEPRASGIMWIIDSGSIIDIGSRRELFVDRYLIDKLDGARLVMHEPERQEVAIRWDRPWEGKFCAYATVLKDGDLYRMYYRGMPAPRHDTATEVTCYAESRDGRTWERPELGLFEVDGSKANNIVLAADRGAHNFCPFIDPRPDCPADERYKAVGGSGKPGLQAYLSADGIRWRPLQAEPIITAGAFDSQNVAFWSEHEGAFVCYFRTFRDGVRTVSRASSPDFRSWSEPVEMNYGDSPPEQLYTNQTQPYFRAPHIYLAFPMRVMFGRRVISEDEAAKLEVEAVYRDDSADGVLMSTRGDNRYDRTFLEAFFRPGPDPGNWVSRVNMAALGVVPTGEGEISLYYSQHYAQPSAHLVRVSLRTDGFVSVHGPYTGGELRTKPFHFTGKRLEMNYATSAAGSLQIELQDAHGRPFEGFTLADCPPISGDEIDGVIRFAGDSDLAKLAGRPVRMRVVLRDADLYSFRFADDAAK